MKTSRSQKDPLLPWDLWVLAIIGIIALLAGLLLNPIVNVINFFEK
jgi:hypothetical protein